MVDGAAGGRPVAAPAPTMLADEGHPPDAGRMPRRWALASVAEDQKLQM